MRSGCRENQRRGFGAQSPNNPRSRARGGQHHGASFALLFRSKSFSHLRSIEGHEREGRGRGRDKLLLRPDKSLGTHKSDMPCRTIAARLADERLTWRRRLHIIDAKIEGRRAGFPADLRHHGRAGAGVHKRRDNPAVHDASLGMPGEAWIIIERETYRLAVDIEEAHPDRFIMRHAVDEELLNEGSNLRASFSVHAWQ